MFNQYGSVLCILCGSPMRLATIESGEAGTSMETFECRHNPCIRSVHRELAMMQSYIGSEDAMIGPPSRTR
jgi:hypothetical protein